ncbi:MAG TPA: hypothetical protein VGM83_10875 [Devosiaceae bacterium]|jgi:uncharacterized protein YjiS (DUF1127 family)
MAYLLSGERPAVAATTSHPLGMIMRWFAKARAARRQRLAFATLLELEDYRLDDLGLVRRDIFEALENPARGGGVLVRYRAHRAHAWHRSQ